MIKKTLQPTNDMYLQFTEEELQTLNMKPGDKFEVKHHEDGSIELRPYVKLELDIEEWPREVLEMIVKESCEQDISANDIISNMLKEGLKNFEKESNEDFFSDTAKCCYEDGGLKSICGCSTHDAVLPTAYNSYVSESPGSKLKESDLSTASHNYSAANIDPNFTNNDVSFTESYAYKYHPERDMLFNPKQN